MLFACPSLKYISNCIPNILTTLDKGGVRRQGQRDNNKDS